MLKRTLGGLAAALLLASLQDARADMFESANAPGLCLNVVVGASSLQPCTGGLAQDFALHDDPATGSTFIVQGYNCVAMAGQGQMLQLSSCSYKEIPPPSVQFTLSGGSVQANGLCLDVMGGGRKAGTKVIGFPCNGQRNQSWTIRQTGATVESGFESLGGSGTEARLSANNAPSMCIGVGPGGQAVLQSCNSAPVLTLFTGGVPTFIMALDTANGSMNCLIDQGSQNQALRFEDCSAEPSDYAKWGLTTNGLLRNEQGLCADVKGGGKAPGTPLIFFKCTGKQNQRFTLIEP